MGEFLEAHPDICYCGFDIVLEMIDQNRKTFPTYRFEVLDITSSTPSRADLIFFTKDLFNHLKFSDVRKALINMKRSGSTYLLASNNFGRANDELSEDNYGASRFFDLCAEPFNLPYRQFGIHGTWDYGNYWKSALVKAAISHRRYYWR